MHTINLEDFPKKSIKGVARGQEQTSCIWCVFYEVQNIMQA